MIPFFPLTHSPTLTHPPALTHPLTTPRAQIEARRKLGLVRYSMESAEEARLRKEREAEDARDKAAGRGNKENSPRASNFRISFS